MMIKSNNFLLTSFPTATSTIVKSRTKYKSLTLPPEFLFEIIDKISGENLFTKGILNQSEIIVKDENGKVVDAAFISNNNQNIINLSAIGWNTNIHNYTLHLSADLKIDIHVKMETRSKDGNSIYEKLEFSIKNYHYEQSNTAGIIKVIVG